MTVLSLIQTELYEALSGDETLSDKISGVFDFVPTGTALPYVVIGDATEENGDLIGEPSYNVTEKIHIYTSAEAGYTSALSIEADVERLSQTITISEYTLAPLRYSKQTLNEGQARHVIISVDYIVSLS